jgi:putative phage-type endonuclease
MIGEAAEIIPPEGYRTPMWYAARRNSVSASEIAAVCGLPSAYGSAFDLWWSKRLGEDGSDDTRATSRGRRVEPLVLEDFEDAHPEFHLDCHVGLLQNVNRPWQVSTPDAIAYEGPPVPVALIEVRGKQEGAIRGGPSVGFDFEDCPPNTARVLADPAPVAVVEAKTAGGRAGWGDEGTDQIPVEYLAQVRWQMDTVGVDVCYVPVWIGFDYRCYVVEQDPEDVAFMRDKALAFLHSLETGDAPSIDSHAATTLRLKQLHPSVDEGERADLPALLIRQYDAARNLRNAADDRVKLAENRIRSLMGGAQYGDVDGIKHVSRSVYEIAEHVRKASTVDRLTVTVPKTRQAGAAPKTVKRAVQPRECTARGDLPAPATPPKKKGASRAKAR